jgi:hypothetical protein
VGYHYDTSEWPVVQFRFVGRLNTAEADRYFADADMLVSGGRAYCCVMDGSEMLMPEAEVVLRQTRWLRNHYELMSRVNRGVAFIAPSAVVRGLVRAVLHFQTLPCPHASFTELAAGLEWARLRAAASL